MKIENVIKYRDYAIICSSILITYANVRFKSELVFDERLVKNLVYLKSKKKLQHPTTIAKFLKIDLMF